MAKLSSFRFYTTPLLINLKKKDLCYPQHGPGHASIEAKRSRTIRPLKLTTNYGGTSKDSMWFDETTSQVMLYDTRGAEKSEPRGMKHLPSSTKTKWHIRTLHPRAACPSFGSSHGPVLFHLLPFSTCIIMYDTTTIIAFPCSELDYKIPDQYICNGTLNCTLS